MCDFEDENMEVITKQVYVVSVEHATISRIDEGTGRVVEVLEVCPAGQSFADDGTTGAFLVLWGMAEGPRETFEISPGVPRGSSSLFIAAHEVDEQDADEEYTTPTARDSGCVLRVPLRPDGSFARVGGGPARDWPYEYLHRGLLNPPSNVAFCSNGHMLVTSFRCREWRENVSPAAQGERVVYEFEYDRGVMSGPNHSLLPASCQTATRGFLGIVDAGISLRGAWSVGCARNHWRSPCGIGACLEHDPPAEVYVTCHATADAPASVVRLEGCGCQPKPKPPSGPEDVFGPQQHPDQKLNLLEWVFSDRGGWSPPPTWQDDVPAGATLVLRGPRSWSRHHPFGWQACGSERTCNSNSPSLWRSCQTRALAPR